MPTAPNDFLEHYGVKGMRWGVRRKSSGIRQSRKPKKKRTMPDAKRIERIANIITVSGVVAFSAAMALSNPPTRQALAKYSKTKINSIKGIDENTPYVADAAGNILKYIR